MAKIFLLIIIALSAGGCAFLKSTEPSVEFTETPSEDAGGSVRLEETAGRVVNSRPEYKIVLYAQSGDWFVQPFVEQPFTEIQEDSTWKSPTHLGTKYAALLVTPDFVPPEKTGTLPEKGESVIAVTIVKGTPLFWQTWWFRTALALSAVFLIITFLRLRFQKLAGEMNVRFEERLAERTRIAQELHDSLLQGFVGVSMQLDVAVDQLPPDSPAKPQLNRIIKTLEQVLEEGRNTVQGLRSSEERNFVNLERRFSQIRRDWDADEKIDFQFTEKGSPQTLCPVSAEEIFYISREALINAFQHSGADKIEVEIEYGLSNLRISVCDNGRGIDAEILDAGRAGHWGLSGMRERARKINADLNITSRDGEETRVDLVVSNRAAFEQSAGSRALDWLARMSPRKPRFDNLKRGQSK